MPRNIKITTDYLSNPESSVLIEIGNTKVICNVTIENTVPPFMKETGKGWVTAEYSMLPRATKTRTRREASTGKITGRTAEIQRMIGRSLRAVIDLTKMNGFTATVDCDVIQADGGTRTAAITGAALALYIAFERCVERSKLIEQKTETDGNNQSTPCKGWQLFENPMKELIAAVSVGIYAGKVVVDLDYEKDSNAEVDMNVVMTESGKFVEIQGTGEEASFSRAELDMMLQEAETTIKSLIEYQKTLIQIEEGKI